MRLHALGGTPALEAKENPKSDPIQVRALGSVRNGCRAAVVWAEDHAEALIMTTLVVMIGVICTLLLWKTARVISLASEFEPVLGVIAALTTISLGALNFLKGRRDRRHGQPSPQQGQNV